MNICLFCCVLTTIPLLAWGCSTSLVGNTTSNLTALDSQLCPGTGILYLLPGMYTQSTVLINAAVLQANSSGVNFQSTNVTARGSTFTVQGITFTDSDLIVQSTSGCITKCSVMDTVFESGRLHVLNSSATTLTNTSHHLTSCYACYFFALIGCEGGTSTLTATSLTVTMDEMYGFHATVKADTVSISDSTFTAHDPQAGPVFGVLGDHVSLDNTSSSNLEFQVDTQLTITNSHMKGSTKSSSCNRLKSPSIRSTNSNLTAFVYSGHVWTTACWMDLYVSTTSKTNNYTLHDTTGVGIEFNYGVGSGLTEVSWLLRMTDAVIQSFKFAPNEYLHSSVVDFQFNNLTIWEGFYMDTSYCPEKYTTPTSNWQVNIINSNFVGKVTQGKPTSSTSVTINYPLCPSTATDAHTFALTVTGSTIIAGPSGLWSATCPPLALGFPDMSQDYNTSAHPIIDTSGAFTITVRNTTFLTFQPLDKSAMGVVRVYSGRVEPWDGTSCSTKSGPSIPLARLRSTSFALTMTNVSWDTRYTVNGVEALNRPVYIDTSFLSPTSPLGTPASQFTTDATQWKYAADPRTADAGCPIQYFGQSTSMAFTTGSTDIPTCYVASHANVAVTDSYPANSSVVAVDGGNITISSGAPQRGWNHTNVSSGSTIDFDSNPGEQVTVEHLVGTGTMASAAGSVKGGRGYLRIGTVNSTMGLILTATETTVEQINRQPNEDPLPLYLQCSSASYQHILTLVRSTSVVSVTGPKQSSTCTAIVKASSHLDMNKQLQLTDTSLDLSSKLGWINTPLDLTGGQLMLLSDGRITLNETAGYVCLRNVTFNYSNITVVPSAHLSSMMYHCFHVINGTNPQTTYCPGSDPFHLPTSVGNDKLCFQGAQTTPPPTPQESSDDGDDAGPLTPFLILCLVGVGVVLLCLVALVCYCYCKCKRHKNFKELP